MSGIQQFGSWLTKWFTAVVVVWAAVAYLIPQAGVWAKPYTNIFLSIILFGMGMTLSLDDFRRIVKMPLMVIVGTVAHYLIMPLLAVALCWLFHLSGMLAVGVILVGCCPSGTSSNVMSFLSRGDVALDVSIGLASTLLAPIMVPLLMSLLASQYVSIPTGKLFLTALQVVLIPLVLGVTVHTLFGHRVDGVRTVMPAVSQLAILVIIGAVVSANHAILFTAATALALPVVVLHNLCGYGLGFAFSRLMYRIYPKGFGYAQQKAITFEVGMQDSGLGATLALQAFAANPIVAIPSTFFSVWHNISGSVLASWWRGHDDRRATARDEQAVTAPDTQEAAVG